MLENNAAPRGAISTQARKNYYYYYSNSNLHTHRDAEYRHM